ncbi:hypothetical protein ACSYDW_03375 [Paeniglutamicibacter sp. R2-26]|uniref:hypothetical protein n=1 Tax=Paeniglutamicibacter sp. R2-26 TaxID=3144417 RepID=UPI003EE5E809
MPTHYRLEAETLAELRERMELEFGPTARIASAERVSQGGIGKFMARKYIEAVIEVPDDEAALPPSPAVLRRAGQRAAALRAAAPVPGAPRSAEGPAAASASVSAKGPGKRPAKESTKERAKGLAKGLAQGPAERPAEEPAKASALASSAGSAAMAALLELADAQEEFLAAPGGARRNSANGDSPVSAAAPGTSPGGPGGAAEFMRLLDGESFAFEPPTGTRAAPVPLPSDPLPPATAGGGSAATSHCNILPSPLDGPGDLVAVIGLWGDGVVAGAQLGPESALRRPAGELAAKFDAGSPGQRPLKDRRDVMAARAAAVESREPLVVSVALNPLQPLADQLELLEALRPDQLWVAVDAGRKAEDTAAWVEQVCARGRVYAVVALHGNETLSPESVLDLGFPVFDVTAPTPVQALSDAAPGI